MIGMQIYSFVFVMWILILIGGGLLVAIIGPLSFTGEIDIHPLVNSGIKVAIAFLLIVVWIIVLSKIKNWIFHKQIKS